MINYKTTIPFETGRFNLRDSTHTRINAHIEATSMIGGQSIDDYVSDVRDFLRVYSPIIDGSGKLGGILSTHSVTHEKEFLILPMGGRIVDVELNPSADEKLLRQITCRRGNPTDIQFLFKGINYIFAYH